MSPLIQFLLSVFFVIFVEILFGGSSLFPTYLIIYLLLSCFYYFSFLIRVTRKISKQIFFFQAMFNTMWVLGKF